MPKKFILFFLLLSSFSLGACVNREQADARLKKGCTAAIEAFLTDGYSIKEVKSASYSEVPDRLDGDRKVSLTISESDGWYESERTYSCNFVEDLGIFNSSHKANIYQLDMHNKVYGKKDGQIVGGLNEWAKITDAVNDAMD